MSWVRLDDGFIDHPKVVGLGDPAFRLWVSLIAYSCRHHTDGVITRVALLSTSRRIGVRNLSRTRRELVACGLLEELEPTTEGGHILHDFADYQPTAEQVEELRAKRAEAGRLGGLRSAESRNAAKQTKQTPSTATNPVPSRTDKRKPPPTPSATSKLETHRVTEGLAAELAQREARRRVDIRDPDAYAAATARRLLNDRRTELAELVNAHPNATIPAGTWSTVTALTAPGNYAIQPGMRWFRVQQAASSSSGSMVLAKLMAD